MPQALCYLLGVINTEHLSVEGIELDEMLFLIWPLCHPPFFSIMLSLLKHPIAYRTEATVGVAISDSGTNCIEQTTEWSACSKSCGMGFSTRVTNRNPHCEMVKQTRLCLVRPCDQEHTQPTDKVGAGGWPPSQRRRPCLVGARDLESHLDASWRQGQLS